MMRSSAYQPLRVEAGDDALAGALELVVRRVEHLEALADQLLARSAPNISQHLPVAVDHQAVARQHQADRREVEGGAVVECAVTGVAHGRRMLKRFYVTTT